MCVATKDTADKVLADLKANFCNCGENEKIVKVAFAEKVEVETELPCCEVLEPAALKRLRPATPLQSSTQLRMAIRCG